MNRHPFRLALVPLTLAVVLVAARGGRSQPASPKAAPAEIAWLEERSMLHQARTASAAVSGHGVQWRHPYGAPQPHAAVKHASVWLLDYPGSVITRPGQTVIATWADPGLWDALRDVGIDLLHTGPLNRSGGVRGNEYTPTLDGWFDRISLDLDPALGTEDEYRRMVAVAGDRKAHIAGDLVPLHTGLGADFHLALRGYKDYPGMYTMVQVAKEDWNLLPEVKGPWEVTHLPKEAAEALTRKGYIPGPINSNDADPKAKTWTGWSASGEVPGADGVTRRWVFLHYFKPMQPALNWLDPSYAARRALAGDVVRTVLQRQTRVVRLDAVPFLGIEQKPGTTETLHFKHPLSVVGTNDVAMLVRKLGGWSFHELNVPLEDLRKFTQDGPDLSYDFITRAQIMHALLTQDAGPLRLSFKWMLDAKAQPVGFVHDLQNHDEITFQLVEPEHRKDEKLEVGGGKTMTGKELKEAILTAMRTKAAGDAAPYNRLYRPEKDGLATTFPGFIAPALGVNDPYNATPEQVKLIARGHLLLAAANGLVPGVFSLSSWDLVGALPVAGEEVEKRTKDGDYRWHNRGGVDLMAANPEAKASAFGLPRAKALYGSVPDQLKDPESFVSQLKAMLAARRKFRVAEGELLAVPESEMPGLCGVVLKLPDHPVAVTLLNFSREAMEVDFHLGPAGKGVADGQWTDIRTGKPTGTGEGGRLRVRLGGLEGTTLVPGGP